MSKKSISFCSVALSIFIKTIANDLGIASVKGFSTWAIFPGDWPTPMLSDEVYRGFTNMAFV